MNTKWWLTVLSLLSVPFVAADTGIISTLWYRVLSIGNLSFLGLSDGSIVAAFVRLLIWLLLFTVFFAVITGLGGAKTVPMSFFNRGQAGIIAGVIATIGAIFLPAQVLLATGVGWATAVALLLIGGPIVGIGVLLMKYPGQGQETKMTVLIKLVLCLLLFWILTAMKFHVTRMM
ncbi:MAG TPA: hypothetical protein VJI32_00990 [Candidatus Nanoarchaeia archaeon]|nr:hypothetical protein [Candidatus Nanoarchaeia archaeon]